MTDCNRKIPQPTPADELPLPQMPDLIPQPSQLAVTQINPGMSPELSIIYKRTYFIEPDKACRPADEQRPLDLNGELHDSLEPDLAPSAKALPEIIGFKTGTDMVVQASAYSSKSVTSMHVGVRIGGHRHFALVTGRRFCEYVNEKVRFTPPEPFEKIPLRYENAYGGLDKPFQDALLKQAASMAQPDLWRRAKPVAQAFLGGNNPLMYPRNRFGKGYIIEKRREFIEGRELPAIERPDDLLTPERLIVGHPLDWPKQPIPAGFDYLDPLSFPRSAMMGMPPPCRKDFDFTSVREVRCGLIPSGYCRGNIMAGPLRNAPDLLHNDASRCAPLGLWLPFLRSNETIILEGMDPDISHYRLFLPGERPVFMLPFGISKNRTVETGSKIYLVAIDMHEKILSIIWTGRTQLKRPLQPGRDKELANEIKIKMTNGE